MQVCEPARELDALEPTGHLAGGVGQDLAVFGGDARRQVVAMGRHELPHREQHLGALRQAGRAPGVRSSACEGHGLVDIGRVGKVHLGGARAGGRVEDRP